MRTRPAVFAVIVLSFGLAGCPRRVPEEDSGPPLPDAGMRDAGPGIPFDGPIVLDDERVRATDPSTLPRGAAPCREPVLARVSFVSDGDTIHAVGEDIVFDDNIRLIGVDTPETSGTVECYGSEASTFTSQLEGHLVWLTYDADCRDDFNRGLAYVHVGNGAGDFWQRQLLRRGYATVFTFAPNDQFVPTFETDETMAASANVGLWSACF